VTELLLERHSWSSGCVDRGQKVVLIADPERRPVTVTRSHSDSCAATICRDMSSPAPGGAVAAALANAVDPSNAVDETIATLGFMVPPEKWRVGPSVAAPFGHHVTRPPPVQEGGQNPPVMTQSFGHPRSTRPYHLRIAYRKEPCPVRLVPTSRVLSPAQAAERIAEHLRIAVGQSGPSVGRTWPEPYR
jgi:hypothetical protein